MALQAGRRIGQVWDDCQHLDELIKANRFNVSCKSERDFEMRLSGLLDAHRQQFKGQLITQVDKDASVQSVYCFGKKHRPDMAINQDGMAIELKYLNGSLDGLKHSIGQSIFYRMRYRFVFSIYVIGENQKETYLNAASGKERDLEDLVADLADEMNIFSYFVPSFSAAPNVKSCLEWNSLNKPAVGVAA